MAKVTKRSGITQCKCCLRSKDEAIGEQKRLGRVCDHELCEFRNEIEEAIRFVNMSVFCINCGSKFTSSEDLYCVNCGHNRI